MTLSAPRDLKDFISWGCFLDIFCVGPSRFEKFLPRGAVFRGTCFFCPSRFEKLLASGSDFPGTCFFCPTRFEKYTSSGTQLRALATRRPTRLEKLSSSGTQSHKQAITRPSRFKKPRSSGTTPGQNDRNDRNSQPQTHPLTCTFSIKSIMIGMASVWWLALMASVYFVRFS